MEGLVFKGMPSTVSPWEVTLYMEAKPGRDSDPAGVLAPV